MRRISLGEYPMVSLTDARSKRDYWASMRSDSSQPEPHEYLERTAREERERAELEELEAIRGDWTVRCLGDTFVDHLRRTTKERTWREMARQLEHDVYPVLGEIPADAVTSDDVRRVLRPIEKRGHLRQRNAVRTTLRWCTGAQRIRIDTGRDTSTGAPTPSSRRALSERAGEPSLAIGHCRKVSLRICGKAYWSGVASFTLMF